MPVVPCVRPSQGSVQYAGEGDGAERFEFLGRGVHEQADFPVAGVIAQRDGRAVGGANAAVGAEDQELLARRAPAGSQPMPASCDQPKRSPEGRWISISGVTGSAPTGPGALLWMS